MLKIVPSFLVLCSVLIPVLGATFPAQAREDNESQTVPLEGYVGVCNLSNLSGLSIIDRESEQVLNLDDYCGEEQAVVQALSPEGDEFWQAFLSVASPTALDFASRAGRQDVANYGTTVCLALDSGSTMQDIRQLQLKGGLPPSFDAAVNVAAINTYCPTYQQQIGR